jgi:hypothetical protein
MTDTVAAWRYTNGIDETRRTALAAPGSFDEVIRLVLEDVRHIRVRSEPGREAGLTDYVQPVFTFKLPDTGDILFNGPWGYRAQYWVSPGRGLAANATLLAALAPKLMATLDTISDPGLAKIDLCASLSAASAKLWIREIPSLLVNPNADLDIERWVLEARRGVELARWGLSAPVSTLFEVKGALIDPYGNEVVPSRKVRRHFDIHHYGFS